MSIHSKPFQQHRKNDVLPYLYTLLLAGYPFAVATTGFFLESTRISSIAMRLVFFGLLLGFGIQAILTRRTSSSFFYIMAGVCFFAFFGTRVFFDLENPYLYVDDSYLLALFFLGTVPSFFVFTSARAVPTSFRTVNFLFKVLFFTISCLVLQIWMASDSFTGGLVAGRLALDQVNPLTLGLLSAHLLLLTIYCYFEKTQKLKLEKLIYLSAAVLSIVVMIMTGSRSPMLAAFVSCSLYFFLTSNASKRVNRVLVLIFLLVLAYFLAEFLTRYFGLSFTGRLEAMFSSESRANSLSINYRMNAFQGGIDMFLNNPVLGKSIVESSTNFYPHNLWIESLMSIGLVGTVFLLIMVMFSFRYAYVICMRNHEHLWIALLFLQLFIFQQFSGSIWGSSALFGMMSAVVVIGKYRMR